MGFGLLFMGILILGLTGILLFIWLITGKKFIGQTIGIIWAGIIGFIIISVFINSLTAKKILNKNDYYGTYVINRKYFKGKQTDWQYNHFRFEISKADSLFFYVTNKENIIKTYYGKISTSKAYESERLTIEMDTPTIHILKTDPTIYRSAWNFYLVFNSEKFKNMYFKKGTWKSIDN